MVTRCAEYSVEHAAIPTSPATNVNWTTKREAPRIKETAPDLQQRTAFIRIHDQRSWSQLGACAATPDAVVGIKVPCEDYTCLRCLGNYPNSLSCSRLYENKRLLLLFWHTAEGRHRPP